MKRFLLPVLLLLLLCGCTSEETAAPAPTVSTTPPTEASEPVDTYAIGSRTETFTKGTVLQYDLQAPVSWILPFEGGVLTAKTGDKTVLTLLTGEKGTIGAETTVSVKLDQSDCQGIPGGVIYYDAVAKQVVLLDAELQETDRLQLPADISGKPAFAQNGSAVYYCVGQTVYAMDTGNKTVRPVRSNTCKEQTLLGCYLDDTVVACRVLDMADRWNTLYISGEDGKLLHKDNNVAKLYSHGDTYFALRADGAVSQYIYGKTTDSAFPVQMNIAAHSAFGALEQGGIIGQTETEDGIVLSFYNMKKTAQVTLPKDQKIQQVSADSTAIWMLNEQGRLLRWDLQETVVSEDVDYTGTIYTAENPDTAGLQACTERADAIGKTHGVSIRIWEKALSDNEDYAITPEYQTEAIGKALDVLEAEFAKFPSKFLQRSVSSLIRICIVRDIDGEVTSAYHWTDGDPFIIISAGMDVRQAFLETLAYIVDIHILGNSAELDDWAALNPEGFTYGKEQKPEAYPNAFVNAQSMESVIDDRAMTFLYAIQEGNGELFKSETMQAKLLMLCKGIRDAWSLKRNTETFLWEQYLTQSIAYQK